VCAKVPRRDSWRSIKSVATWPSSLRYRRCTSGHLVFPRLCGELTDEVALRGSHQRAALGQERPSFLFGRPCTCSLLLIADFWEFREGDRLLITNREGDYPAAAEQMEEGGPSLWKVLPGDRLAWVKEEQMSARITY